MEPSKEDEQAEHSAGLYLCPGAHLPRGNSWNPGLPLHAGLDAPRKTLFACLSGLANGGYSAGQRFVHAAAGCHTEGEPSALDSDVVPAMSDSGQNVFALTEEAVKHGGLRLEIHRADYNNAEMHAYLGNLIYRNQNLVDLSGLLCGAGWSCFSRRVASDLSGWQTFCCRAQWKKPRSLELIPVAQLNRTRSSRGLGFVNRLHTMLKRVLDINKKSPRPAEQRQPFCFDRGGAFVTETDQDACGGWNR